MDQVSTSLSFESQILFNYFKFIKKELEPGDGPIAIILAPTRELAQQVFYKTLSNE